MIDTFGSIIIGMLIGLLVGAAIFTIFDDDFYTICTYEGGTVEGSVCIRDGRVLELDLD